MNPIRHLQNRIRGWLPKEPAMSSNRRPKMVGISEKERERKTFKITMAANAIILNIFLLSHLLIDPFNTNIGFAVISWTTFILSLIWVNFLLYRQFYKKTSNQLEKLRQ
jgi:hypothetical protein